VTSMSVAASTRALIIGISDYSDNVLRLKFASANAQALAGALCLPDGCGLSREQVTVLRDSEASRHAVLEALTMVSKACRADDTLIVYFSGHGEATDQSFSLLTFDSSRAQLRETSLASEDLQSALAQCLARGVILVLDCCKSAGFAENASKFFVTLGTRDFRLMLSASRIGQSSYEFDSVRGSVFTDALVRVLHGEVTIGNNTGAIYFADLFEYLQLRVAEGLELIGVARNLQEPVFAGTFSRDPLLFLLRRRSFERLEAETPKYSSRFVRARLRRLAAGFAAATFGLLAFYYTYLDHARYVWQETEVVSDPKRDYISIYRGDLGLNWLGFPHRIITTDIAADALNSAIRPGVGRPLKARWGEPVEEELRGALSPEWRTALSVWEGNREAAWKASKDIDVFDEPNLSGADRAAEALAAITGPKDLDHFEDLMSPDASSSNPPLLRRMAELAPEQAIAVLGDDFDDSLNRRAVLEGLGGKCSQAVLEFIRGTAAHASDDSYSHNAWFGAALRSQCRLGAETLLKASIPRTVWERGLDWLPLLTVEDSTDVRHVITRELTQSLDAIRSHKPDGDTYAESLKSWMLLRTAAIVDPSSVPDEAVDALEASYKHLRYAAALALGSRHGRSDLQALLCHVRDPWVLAALVDTGWFDYTVARTTVLSMANRSQPAIGAHTDGSVIFLLERLRIGHVTAALALVHDIQQRFHAPEVQIELLRTMNELTEKDVSHSHRVRGDVLTAEGQHPLASFSRFGLARGTYGWVIRNDPQAFRDFLSALGDGPDDAAELLGRAELPIAIVAQLERRVNSSLLGLKACVVVTMRGSANQLLALLSSPDVNIRHQADIYAAYNPHIEEVLENPSLQLFGTETRFFLAEQVRLRKRLSALIKATKGQPVATVIDIVALSRTDVSQGLTCWLKDQAGEDGDGPLMGWMDELFFDNSPGPFQVNSR
jgi:hypothetical protein